MGTTIIWIIVAALVALVAGYMVAMSRSKKNAASEANIILEEARNQADVIKEKKLLQAREQEMKIKNDAEKQASQRLQKVQAAEARLKQREIDLNRQQSDFGKRKKEVEELSTRLERESVAVETRTAEVERMHKEALEKLEHLSGLSAEEAKERLVESLKDEAKTAAASYINDIMDDARISAAKEAKRIVIQSIQRVATETAVENSVTVFHIDSDEVKGRIIGREGRNIRALEAATGIEIIVDDTPEAIVLSGFDPVRREIARLALH
ncbi:MAG: Rnase Y domain-containing protein, partial [Muribaculaceae bacterium]|nr:Rnase Y domain-containing protein [Muribaculaceae bacterium]